MGGGILPVALHKGTLYFLFGREVYNQKWGAFGGGREGNERKFQTAIREGCEEMDGFLGSQPQLIKMVKENMIKIINIKAHRMYLFRYDYDEKLPFYFNNHHQFTQRHLPEKINKSGLYEKCEMRWFTLDEMLAEKEEFNYIYKYLIDNINEICDEIEGCEVFSLPPPEAKK